MGTSWPAIKLFIPWDGSRSAEEFLGLLRVHDLEMVADVRSFRQAGSAFPAGGFETKLGRSGIGYVYLGKELGGRRPGGFEPIPRPLPISRGSRAWKDWLPAAGA